MLGIFLAWGSILGRVTIFSGLKYSRIIYQVVTMMDNYLLYKVNYLQT
jgi:hypothetical protein